MVVTLWKKYKRVVFVAASIAGITALFISGIISLLSPKVTEPRIEHLNRDIEATRERLNNLNNKHQLPLSTATRPL